MDVNSHFFHYWHGMTVFIRGVIIVVVVVKWSYFPRPAVSVYLRVTNQAFPQCLWIKQEVSFPKLWFRLSSLISRKTPSLRSYPLPIIPLCLEPQKQKKREKMTPDLSLQNTPRDPHWRIIHCPLNKYPHANFSDWSPYIYLKNKLRKLFLKRSKQDCGLGYMKSLRKKRPDRKQSGV